MPAQLKSLMRHADIETTMKYYVDIQADDVAAELWNQFGPQNKKNPEQATEGAIRGSK